MLVCGDLADGKVLWDQRLKGPFSASPVFADGKIYVVNEEGMTTVFKAGPEAKVLATNELKDTILATPSIANGSIYLRPTSFSTVCVLARRAASQFEGRSCAHCRLRRLLVATAISFSQPPTPTTPSSTAPVGPSSAAVRNRADSDILQRKINGRVDSPDRPSRPEHPGSGDPDSSGFRPERPQSHNGLGQTG